MMSAFFMSGELPSPSAIALPIFPIPNMATVLNIYSHPFKNGHNEGYPFAMPVYVYTIEQRRPYPKPS